MEHAVMMHFFSLWYFSYYIIS